MSSPPGAPSSSWVRELVRPKSAPAPWDLAVLTAIAVAVPVGVSLVIFPGDPAILDAVASALIGIRGAKSQAKVSMKHELSAVEFTGPQGALDAVRSAQSDLVRVGRVTSAPTYTAADGELSVTATVATEG